MLNWTNFNLRKQFLLLFLITLLAVLSIVFFYLNHNQRVFYLEQLELKLRQQGRLIIENNKLQLTEGDFLQEGVDRWAEITGGRITVIASNGRVLADSHYNPAEMDNHRTRPEVLEVIKGRNWGQAVRKSRTLDQEMFYLALPVWSEGSITALLRLSMSLQEINRVIYGDVRRYLYFFLLVLAFTLPVIWWFSRAILNPLNRITGLAGRLAEGRFEERINLRNHDNEIGFLARTMNFMADQLEHKIREISEEKSRNEAVITSMKDGLIAIDRGQKIRLLNPAARELLGLPEGNFINREVIEVVRHYRIVSLLQEAMNKRKDLSEEIVVQKPEKRLFLCHFTPVKDRGSGGDRVIGGVVAFTDITELRRLEQVRKEFAANVSHELRTPLTSIVGYVDTLLEQEIEDPATTRRFLEVIKSEADRLELLIKDLLALARLENEERQNLLKPGSIQQVIESAVDILADSAREKRIELRTELENSLPPVLMIPEQISQVFINLIDNSIKYTPEGGELVIRAFKQGGQVVLEVEDNGIGIPAGDQERIFERFYRVDKARSRALGGTGIGLSIVKHIIQNHMSTIEVESEPGKGSVFRFFLKAEIQTSNAAPAERNMK